MSKYVVVVESPAKAKTIHKYLGADYQVFASYGHVRDLENKSGAVDPEAGFMMHYEPISRNAKHVDSIVKALKGAEGLFLATDPDREGEAISWHLHELLKGKRCLGNMPVKRVLFYEITQTAIRAAIQAPREISMELVNAQQARRALDYLVGFTLSPLLWKKIRRGLSAGRVQSPALRLIVEREIEIEQFVAQEYWTLTAHCVKGSLPFDARLVEYQSQKLEKFTLNAAEPAMRAKHALLEEAGDSLWVKSIQRKQKNQYPAPPFTTSTLQQEGVRKLGFTTKKTMMLAQQLYEGVDIGEGTVGLITYMRTDSFTLSQDALSDVRGYILDKFGEDNLPDAPRIFKTKSKNAQEAHEAIRPTSIFRQPESMKPYLTPDQFKLYQLIWKRTVACQMAHAILDTLSIGLVTKPLDQQPPIGEFRVTGSTVVKPGYMRVYQEGVDEAGADGNDEERVLPDFVEGEKIALRGMDADQHFTEPPPRYSEASLVKALEEFGIGRPSTYAAIVSTLQQRDYVILDKKRFRPTDVGRIVNRFLTQYFTQYVDYGFTSGLEDELDAVSRGEESWIPLLERFWGPFKSKIHEIGETVKRADVTQEVIEEACPKCGHPLSIRLGKSGRFVGCTHYPECDFTRNLPGSETTDEQQPDVPERVEGRSCPKCGGALHIKQGPYGKFIGCTGYPSCRFIEPLNKPKDTGVTCPKCQEGVMMERRSKKGKPFFSCDRYPKCDYATWNQPIAEACPQCHWPILTIKSSKKGDQKVCPQKECGYQSETMASEGDGNA